MKHQKLLITALVAIALIIFAVFIWQKCISRDVTNYEDYLTDCDANELELERGTDWEYIHMGPGGEIEPTASCKPVRLIR